MEIDYRAIGAGVAVITLWGGIMLAAAKSIFITKVEFSKLVTQMEDSHNSLDRKLYDKHNVPLYVLRAEWELSKERRERNRDIAHASLITRMDGILTYLEKMRTDQEETRLAINRLETIINEGRRL